LFFALLLYLKIYIEFRHKPNECYDERDSFHLEQFFRDLALLPGKKYFFFFTSRLAHAPPPISIYRNPSFLAEERLFLLREEVQAFFVCGKLIVELS
jgi:hypothetical protein